MTATLPAGLGIRDFERTTRMFAVYHTESGRNVSHGIKGKRKAAAFAQAIAGLADWTQPASKLTADLDLYRKIRQLDDEMNG